MILPMHAVDPFGRDLIVLLVLIMAKENLVAFLIILGYIFVREEKSVVLIWTHIVGKIVMTLVKNHVVKEGGILILVGNLMNVVMIIRREVVVMIERFLFVVMHLVVIGFVLKIKYVEIWGCVNDDKQNDENR